MAQMSEELQAKTLRQKIDAEQRFRQAFDNAPIGMALLSPDLSLLEVNAAFCDMFGYREVDILLKNIEDFIRADDRAICLSAFASLAAGKARNYKVEMQWQAAHGRLVWSRITLAAVVDTDKHPVRFILQVEDIAKRA